MRIKFIAFCITFFLSFAICKSQTKMDWKSYSDKQFRFSVDYLSDWNRISVKTDIGEKQKLYEVTFSDSIAPKLEISVYPLDTSVVIYESVIKIVESNIYQREDIDLAPMDFKGNKFILASYLKNPENPAERINRHFIEWNNYIIEIFLLTEWDADYILAYNHILNSFALTEKEEEKFTKKEVEQSIKELQEYNSLQTENLVAIDPALPDEFIKSYISNEMDKLYDMVADDIKEMQSKEEMTSFLELFTNYYGKILSYEQTEFGMKTRAGFGQLVTLGYELKFEKYKGKASGVFKVIDSTEVKMFAFNISLNDYTTVETFDKIAKPVINALQEKDKKKVYNLTSTKFKEYVSISDFESRINKIVEIDILDYKMFRNQVGIKDGNEILALYYAINDETGYLQFSFTKSGDKFELDGLNYIPKP